MFNEENVVERMSIDTFCFGVASDRVAEELTNLDSGKNGRERRYEI